jgi:hypothetical protein
VQADKFVIVDSSGNFATSPFFVDSGTVYIGSANIQNLSVTKLTAGNFGASMVLDSGGVIRSGQTAFNTGTGFWLSNTGGTPQFSIGNGSTNYLAWNGTTLSIAGSITITNTIPAGNVSGLAATATNSDYSAISGTKPASNADNTSTAINNTVSISGGGLALSGGSIYLNGGGSIYGGMSSYLSGTGFFLGYTGGAYKFSVGNSSGNYMAWDGSSLNVVGTIKSSYIDHASKFIRDPNSDEGGQLFLQMPVNVSGDWAADVFSDNSLRFFVEGNAGVASTAKAEFQADLYARTYNISSSKRFKTNLRPILSPLQKVSAMRGVYFDWTTRDKNNDIGVIAEEVNEVVPEVVAKDAQGLPSAVDYSKLVPVLIEAIKELDAEVKTLKARLDANGMRL